MSVAVAMKTPGSPKAISGLCRRGLSRKLIIDGDNLAMKPSEAALYGSSNQGISSVDNANPALMEKENQLKPRSSRCLFDSENSSQTLVETEVMIPPAPFASQA